MKSLTLRPAIMGVAVVAFVLAIASPGAAQNKAVESQARGLQKKAMQEDYLATEFEKAQEKLVQAVARCPTEKCSPQLRAELRRDLGVVQVGGQLDRDKGFQNWVEALKLEPMLQLDPDVRTKELEKQFEDARKVALGGPLPANRGGPPAAEAGQGDFVHTPPPEQLVRTPLPVYVEYAGPEQVTRVVAKYKGFGMPEWKSFELKRFGKGFGGYLPCQDVTQGDVVYYIQGFNPQSDPVATSGDRNTPFRVPAKAQLDGEAPHLPGQAAPKQCGESATNDCPPDFPGCKGLAAGAGPSVASEDTKRGEGEDCDTASECNSHTCSSGKCAAGGNGRRRFWIGLSGGLDFAYLSSASNVCKLDYPSAVPTSKYYCTTADGTDYPSRHDVTQNNNIQSNQLDTISGGGAVGNIRLALTLDYALSPNFLLGARLGWVFRTYSGTAAKDEGKAFAPIHGEVRATYLFGHEPLAKAFAAYALLGAGVAASDAFIDVNVVEVGATPQKQTVQAWSVNGPGLVTAGFGGRFGLDGRSAILVAPLKFSVAFGSNGVLPSFSPELAFQVGF